MFGLGTGELILIFLAILLLFGAKRIPEIARGLGTGIREFKRATREIQDELSRPADRLEPPRPPLAKEAPEDSKNPSAA
ncbi:MAG: twin-arginine translocase TatA/TatE family subunit [Bacteroidetes bacterium]|nr:twin-arginine translocase TatA/TatE family subunit [Rhodothermia bacterium]MCS7154328.1 twin-arginine translocase TatA/TatE family subunit [Bacteroidota bacterium]MCX7906635.1 twin-arginine translocase TatA/TatE family subunit [Bacteroidota bacterium]MDW8137084.1 twin-arginine translocase TatA/TatE family subunit [Bacteroidota bacterium]MDW8285045.1 twin-arginine translocase TatA/TatE family subunit [Bacteroidota bacterium]